MNRMNGLLRKTLKRVVKPQTGWLDVFPAVIGTEDGTVDTGTPGVIYVRNVLNGQTLRVHNAVAPAIATLQVEVGRRVEDPGLWQVKGVRESFATPASSGNVAYHAAQHTFPEPDTVWIDRKQLLPLTVLVSDADNFIVQIYGATVRTMNGVAIITTQEVDLSTYVPATGALYVNIETDDDGVLSVHSGTGFDAPELAAVSDVPVPTAGKYMLAFVLLTEGMTTLSNDNIRVPVALETNPLNFSAASTVHTYEQLVYEINTPNAPMNCPTINIEGALATATGVGGAWIAEQDGEIESFLIYCRNNGSSGSTIVDVNKNGTTIFSTSGNRPTFGNTDTAPVESARPDVYTFVKGDVFTFDIDAIATGAETLTLVPLAHGYREYDFITDEDGLLVFENVEVETI